MMPRKPSILVTAFGKTQTLTEWSKETGIHRATLYHRIVRLNWNPEKAVTPKNGARSYNRRRKMKTVSRRRKVKQLFLDDGLTPYEIAEHVGKSPSMIWRDLRHLGLSWAEQKAERRRKVWDMVGTMSQTEMAKVLSVSDATIHDDIKAILADRSIIQEEIKEDCMCGKGAEHVVRDTIRSGTNIELYLCDSCYQIETEEIQR